MPDWKRYVRGHLPHLEIEPEREIEIVEELAEHLEAAYQDALTNGASEQEAYKLAAALFADWRLMECELSRAERPVNGAALRQLDKAMEQSQSEKSRRRLISMESLLRDLRFGLRALLKRPGFTLIAVITLSLGIGVNTAIFSSIDALMLRPLDCPDLDRLVALSETPGEGFGLGNVAPADFLDWKSQSAVFESLAVFQRWESNLTGVGEPEHLRGLRVSPGFFQTLGVKAALGRTFTPDEEQPGRDQVAVIGYGLWQRRFAADPHIVGTTISLNGASFSVIGVMPPEFDFPKSTAVWAPLPLTGEFISERKSQYLAVIARLKPAITKPQAQAEMDAIASRLEQLHPQTNTGRRVAVALLRDRVVGDFTPMYLWSSMGAVLFVLLIACANIANMQLARGAGRASEIAIRAAMGATRWRIIRQLLTENALLALLGGALGILMALWMLALMKTSIPPEITRFTPGFSRMAINTRALGFTFVIALLAGIVSGLAPAFQASKPDLSEALKEGKRSSAAGVGHSRLRGLLVISEVALALALLVGAGLMVKGFARLAENLKHGFSPENVLTMGVSLSRTRYPETYQVRAFYQQSLERIEKLPEVVSAGAATFLPASGGWSTVDLFIAGRPDPAPGQSQSANLQVVTPHYFQTLRIPIIEGRDFASQDQAEAPRVAIISAELQRRYFPDEEPLGKRIRVGSPASDWATIVGVVGDVMRFHFDKRWQPMVYLPHSQSPARAMYLVARGSDNPLGLAAAVRAQALSVDKEQPVFDITTVEKMMTDQVSGVRIGAMMMALFGLIALLLSAVGVYGVMAYSVEQRTHEIGVRMALGAQPRDALKLVVGQGMALALIGIGIGLIAAFGLARLMANLLFGVSSTDALTFALVSLSLAAIALLACYIPARRAAKVDPLVALRHE